MRCAVVLLCACGARTGLEVGVGSDLPMPDGATPVPTQPPPPNPKCPGPFAAATLVGGVNGARLDSCARLSPDELHIFFNSSRDNPGAQWDNRTWDLYAASRTNVAAPFSNVIRLASLNSNVEDACPTVTADLLTIYFQTRRTSGSLEIWSSTRASPSADFPPPARVPALNPPGWQSWLAIVAPDGKTIYFTGMDGSGTSRLYRAPVGGSPVLMPIGIPNDEAPVPSPDERLVLFVRRESTSSTNFDVFAATRSDDVSPYAVAKVSSLSTPSYDLVTWLSPDGCRAYITSDRPGTAGELDIWVTGRQ